MSTRSKGHRAIRALAWLVGAAGLFAAAGLAVVPAGQRGLRSGLGEPTDLAPGLHLVLRPLQSVALHEVTLRLTMGLATREDDADRRPGAGPALRATTRDGVEVSLTLLVAATLEDARVDADDLLRGALARAVHTQPLSALEAAETAAAAQALTRDANAHLAGQGVRVQGVQLVGVALSPAREAERDAAVVSRLAAQQQAERARLDQQLAAVLQAESAAARATEDTERALAAERAAEDQAARLAQVHRLGEVLAEQALGRAAVDAQILVLEAEAGRIRARARAAGQRRLSAALQGPGFEAYVSWVGQGFDTPMPPPCPPPSSSPSPLPTPEE